MHDQADQLRRLVLGQGIGGLAPNAPPPPLVTVVGGKGGVGTTTIAVNLAVALAGQGQRVVLVDANLQQPDIAVQCRIDEKGTLADVLAGRRTVHEVLERGPFGIQVLPGAWAPDRSIECSPAAQQRLLAELARLGPHADVIVLDGGRGLGSVAQRFALASSLVLVVTTSQSVSIMDSYATIKSLHTNGSPPPIHTVVNKANGGQHEDEVHQRIAQACRRFVKAEVSAAATVREDETLAVAVGDRSPIVIGGPDSRNSTAIDQLAEHAIQVCSRQDLSTIPALPRRTAS